MAEKNLSCAELFLPGIYELKMPPIALLSVIPQHLPTYLICTGRLVLCRYLTSCLLEQFNLTVYVKSVFIDVEHK